jgi:hypothetical protein
VVQKPCGSQYVGQKLRCLDIKQRIFRGLLSCHHAICVQVVFRIAFFAGFPIPVFATHIVLRFKVRSNKSFNATRYALALIPVLYGNRLTVPLYSPLQCRVAIPNLTAIPLVSLVENQLQHSGAAWLNLKPDAAVVRHNNRFCQAVEVIGCCIEPVAQVHKYSFPARLYGSTYMVSAFAKVAQHLKAFPLIVGHPFVVVVAVPLFA